MSRRVVLNACNNVMIEFAKVARTVQSNVMIEFAEAARTVQSQTLKACTQENFLLCSRNRILLIYPHYCMDLDLA
jgi:hypothetical protein